MEEKGVAMIIRDFMNWWNRLALRNGKVKFRSQREAAEFVRALVNSSGGPNKKVLEMRRQYEVIQGSRPSRPEDRPEGRKVRAAR
jgi:hypothetical protein